MEAGRVGRGVTDPGGWRDWVKGVIGGEVREEGQKRGEEGVGG